MSWQIWQFTTIFGSSFNALYSLFEVHLTVFHFFHKTDLNFSRNQRIHQILNYLTKRW